MHHLGYLCSSRSWGGLEMNHLRNARWMVERGHPVTIICVHDSPIEKQAIEWGLRVINIDDHKKYYDRKNASKLVNILKIEAITHLLIRSTRDMSITASIKARLGNSIKTAYFMEMQLGVKKTHILHTIRFKGIDVWSCPLNWLKSQVESMTKYKNELVVIPSGIEINEFSDAPDRVSSRKELGIDLDTFYFGLIGRIDVQKGQLLVIEAMHRCANKEFKVVFLGEATIGEGDQYQNELLEKISSYELNDRVSFKPFRKNTSVFYSAIDELIMATKAETFGMVTIESLATGTPVLGSNKGGTVEILQDPNCGTLFESMDMEDLASKMNAIVTNKGKIDHDYIKRSARKYDHNSVCAAVEKILNIA